MQLFSAVVTALVLLAVPTIGAPPSAGAQFKTLNKYAGLTKPDSYIVKLKADVSKDYHLAWLAANHNASSIVTHGDWHPTIFHGYAGTLNKNALDALLAHPDVDYIEENGIGTVQATVIQARATWGLGRISQNTASVNDNPNGLEFRYSYDSSAGANVDVYIIDTGIYLNHTDFGGRAIWGATFSEEVSQTDGNGHGTHVAGTVGGTIYGVAKQARLIAVKTVNSKGLGATADTISGVNFVARNANTTRRASVVNMSLGFKPSTALDEVCAALVARGVHFVVAAGNENSDALTTSPPRSRAVIVVGSTDILDRRLYDSNFGPAVNLFAPGGYITSAGIRGPTSTDIMSGTSMATPHVAGMIAVFISESGNTTPATMLTKLTTLGVKNVLINIPAGTANILARNDKS